MVLSRLPTGDGRQSQLSGVLPGPAHARTTELSTAPLRGSVGLVAESGCYLTMHAADRMGNLCSSGGAKVAILCDNEDMETNVDDQSDGTYVLSWRSKFSGTFKLMSRLMANDG